MADTNTEKKVERGPRYSEEMLDHIFDFHKASYEQGKTYEAIRKAAKDFARVVVELTPSSPDQTVAVRKIREAVMVANAAIALDGRS